MKIKNLFLAGIACIVLFAFSGCGLIPDRAVAWMKPDPNKIPFNRIDVYNNIEGTVMVLSDRGGVRYQDNPIKTGEFGWMPQSTYFNAGGYDQINDNVITARFYDAVSHEYLGLYHWQVWGGYNRGYWAFHSPYERKSLEHERDKR